MRSCSSKARSSDVGCVLFAAPRTWGLWCTRLFRYFDDLSVVDDFAIEMTAAEQPFDGFQLTHYGFVFVKTQAYKTDCFI